MASISTSSGQSTSTGQGTSESHGRSYIPDYPQAPLLQAIAQYAFDQAPQIYQWGMDQFNKNQGNIDSLMRDAQSYASPQRISVDMGMAESGVQQAAEKGRLSAVRDLEGYGIDPSSGRYAALDKANRVMSAASAAGAGNQQRMADEAAGNAMRNQAISASLQNTQVGYEAAKAMNALLSTGSQLKYPPLGNVSDTVSQHTQESQSTQRSQSTSDQGGGGGGGGPGVKSGGSQPTIGGGGDQGGGGGGGPAGGARAPAAPRGGAGAGAAPKPGKPPKIPAEKEAPPVPPEEEPPPPPDDTFPPGVDPENPSGPYDPTKDPANPEYIPPDQREPTTTEDIPQPPEGETPVPTPRPPGADEGQTLTEDNPLGGRNPLLDPEAGQPWQTAGGEDWRAPIGDQGGVTDQQDVTGTGEGQGPEYQLPGDYAGQFDPSQYDQTGIPGDYAGDPIGQFDILQSNDPSGGLGVPAEMWGNEETFFSGAAPSQDVPGPDQDVSGTGAEAAGGYDFSGQDFTQYDPYSDQGGTADANQYDNWGDTGAQYDQTGDQSQYDFGGTSDYYDSSQYGDQGNWDTGQYDTSGDQSYDTSGDQTDTTNYDTSGDNWDTSGWDTYGDQSNWDTSGDNWAGGDNTNYDYGDAYSNNYDQTGDYSGDTGGGDYTDNTDYSGDYGYARGGPVGRRQPMPMRMRGPMRRPKPGSPRLGGRPRPPMRPMRPPMGTGYNPNPRLPFGPRSGGPMVRPEPRPQPPNIPRMAAGGPMRQPQPAPNITQMAAGGPPAMPRGGYLQASGMPQSQAGAIPMPGGGMQAPQRMQRGGPAQRPRGPNPQQATQGGFVSRELSPSGGSQTDDVNAQLNAGEFVIPKDVAKWKGREFFYKLIQQARKQGQGGGQPPTTGYGGPRQ